MNTLLRIATLTLGASLAGCASHYDARFGDAVRQANAAQIMNPQAGKEVSAVTLLDGQAAVHALARYRSSFKEPPPSFTIIGLGSQGGGAR